MTFLTNSDFAPESFLPFLSFFFAIENPPRSSCARLGRLDKEHATGPLLRCILASAPRQTKHLLGFRECEGGRNLLKGGRIPPGGD